MILSSSSDKPDPFTPPAPFAVDLDDGSRLVEGFDNCYRFVEPNGKVSGFLLASSPRPIKVDNPPFRVRSTENGQIIVTDDGDVVATTTDADMARHICVLLIAYRNIQQRNSSPAS